MKTNKTKLVKQSVQGKIQHPSFGGYRVTTEGQPFILPATGGITYNVHVGDPAFGWVGDHVEPGVSVKNEIEAHNAALGILSCVGNEIIDNQLVVPVTATIPQYLMGSGVGSPYAQKGDYDLITTKANLANYMK